MISKEKVETALQYLRFFEPKTEPYYVCYSGGKDSDVIRILCDMAGVNYELHNNHTTVDAPETVYYIRDVMKTYGQRVKEHDPIDGHRIDRFGERGFIHYPLETMGELIVRKHFPPTRLARFCCEELKEKGGFGRRKVTGVRWAESKNRRDNQGLVTIIGLTKEQKEELTGKDFFLSTGKGGWY